MLWYLIWVTFGAQENGPGHHAPPKIMVGPTVNLLAHCVNLLGRRYLETMFSGVNPINAEFD